MARVRVEVPVENTPVQHAPNQPEKPAAAHAEKPNRQLRNRLIVFVLVIFAGIFITNLISDKNKLEKQLNTKQDGGTQQVNEIVASLAESIELPVNETPQTRTIEDASKFTQQNPSLADIRNGDMLLFFPKSQKVVVYRPSSKKAVVVVTLSQPTTDQTVPAN